MMARMLGFMAALAEWRWHRTGGQKAASRRRQRARETERVNRWDSRW